MACWWRLQSSFQPWVNFKQSFRKELLLLGYKSHILWELDLRTQHPNESLIEYVWATQELYCRSSLQMLESEQVTCQLRQSHLQFCLFLHNWQYFSFDDVTHNAHSIQESMLAKLQAFLCSRLESILSQLYFHTLQNHRFQNIFSCLGHLCTRRVIKTC